MRLAARFLHDERAASAIEYGLIAAGVAVTVIAVVQELGGKLVTTFTVVRDALQ